MSHPEWSAWRLANHAFFFEHLTPFNRSLKLIDLGAGPVQFGDLFKQFNYVGVDFAEYPDVSVVTDLTKRLPFEDSSADIVTLSNTLEHIPYPIDLLKECHRILRTGGTIVATTPFLLPVHQAPYDFNRYTNFQFERMLKDAEFSEIQITPLGNQLDTYNTIELKTFDELYQHRSGLFFEFVRTWRRAEMRLLRKLFYGIPASAKVTEGYGFKARK